MVPYHGLSQERSHHDLIPMSGRGRFKNQFAWLHSIVAISDIAHAFFRDPAPSDGGNRTLTLPMTLSRRARGHRFRSNDARQEFVAIAARIAAIGNRTPHARPDRRPSEQGHESSASRFSEGPEGRNRASHVAGACQPKHGTNCLSPRERLCLSGHMAVRSKLAPDPGGV